MYSSYISIGAGDLTATVFCFKTIAIRGKAAREQENSGCIWTENPSKTIDVKICFS